MAGCENSTRLSDGDRQAVAGEWLRLAAAAYPTRTAGLLLSDADPFRNPAGDALRRGLPVLLDTALGDTGFEAAAPVLDELLHIRSVQAATADDAVSFLSALKPVLRGHASLDGRVEERIDRLEQMALNAWARCRSALETVRENEKRRRNWLAERMRRS